MRFAHFFIDHPVFAAVSSIVIVIAGSIALYLLPVARYPQIVPPTVTVSTTYPGASAATVAATVAAPIEQQVNGVENLLSMSSQSTNDGNMTLTATFKVGTNLDAAQVQVQNRVAIAQPALPQEVRRQGVVVRKASPDCTMVVVLFSPNGTYDSVHVSNSAALQVRDELARLPGVGDVHVFGARDYAMRLWLDPDRLAARSLTAGDFVQAVQDQNVQVAAGVVGGPPQPRGATQFQYTVTTHGRLVDPKQFEDIIIKTGADGRVTRVRDVARVELSAADFSTSSAYDGLPSVALGISQLPGSNAIQTATAVRAKMAELKQRFPPDLDWAAPYDTTLFVRESMRAAVVTLLEAIGLVVLVVLVFLQSWRASVVPLVAIAVSLIGTFAVVWAFGFSLNTLTLFGLVLAIGIVVDDAIVVVETVERWIGTGLTPREATYRAMSEVTPAVIAIGFGLSAAFVAVGFGSGISGQFYRHFGLTIASATLLSAFNSLTLSPALTALLLKPRHGRQDWLTRLIDVLFGWFFRLFNRGRDAFNRGYAAVLHRVVRLSLLVLVVYAGLLFLTYLGFKSVPTSFIPPQDQGYLLTVLQMPDAASIERTRDTMDRLSVIARKTPGVAHAITISGHSLLTGTSSSSAATMFVILDPSEKRAGEPGLGGEAITGKLLGQFAAVQEGLALVFPPPPFGGIGSAGGFRMMIQDRSGQATPQDLQAAVERVIAEASGRPEVSGLVSSFRAGVPQLYANLDPTRAARANVKSVDVFNTLQVYLGSLDVGDFNYLGRTYRVLAQADAPFRATAADVARLRTRNADGQMVPLGSVMELKDTAGPDRVQRYNLYAAAEIDGNAAPGHSSGEAIAAMEAAARATLPEGYGFERTDLASHERLAGTTALFILPLCILFVWLTHSAAYGSFALSTAVILTLPMCLLSAIAAVYFAGQNNNVFTQIGLVVLAGMSVKYAALIVAFAKQQQEHRAGMTAADAAVEAARLRPILMTSFAFMLGALPLVIAKGAGAEMRVALGRVIVWGMIGVAAFGLVLTPVFYTVIRRLTGKNTLAHGGPGETVGAVTPPVAPAVIGVRPAVFASPAPAPAPPEPSLVPTRVFGGSRPPVGEGWGPR